MLSLELIGVLGALFVFLVLAMVRTQVARREVKVGVPYPRPSRARRQSM
jgi:hypothetical protein